MCQLLRYSTSSATRGTRPNMLVIATVISPTLEQLRESEANGIHVLQI